MSYKIYTKDVSDEDFTLFSVVKSFDNAIKLEIALRKLGCNHILCLGVDHAK